MATTLTPAQRDRLKRLIVEASHLIASGHAEYERAAWLIDERKHLLRQLDDAEREISSRREDSPGIEPWRAKAADLRRRLAAVDAERAETDSRRAEIQGKVGPMSQLINRIFEHLGLPAESTAAGRLGALRNV